MSGSGSLSISLDPPDVKLVVLGHRKVGKTGKLQAILYVLVFTDFTQEYCAADYGPLAVKKLKIFLSHALVL